MSWQCPECGSTNDGSLLRCDCGHVLDIPLDDKLGTQFRNRESAIKETDFYEVVIDKTLQQTELASTGQRIGNMFLDLIFFFIIAFIIGLNMALIGLEDLIEGMNDYLLGIIVTFFYYVPQEALSGRTLGKMITGTKVVKEDGTKLTFGRALNRTLCRYIPFEAFSFLSGSGRPRGWHDRISKTKVISIKTDGSFSFRFLNLVFTKPVYIFSWIVLIGLSILIFVIWPIPFVPPPLEILLLILIFWGIINANIAKRKRKSPLLWFFIGLIPIGLLYLVVLQFLRFIVFSILAGGEL